VFALTSVVRLFFVATGEYELVVISSSGVTSKRIQRVLRNGAPIPQMVVDVLLISSRYRIRRPLHDPLCVTLAPDGEGLLCIADSESAAV
jgi:hypothetical protein